MKTSFFRFSIQVFVPCLMAYNSMLKTKSLPSDYTFHEFITVNHHCGFSSMHGDGKELSIDLCQQCFFGMCGDILTVIGPTYESSE